MERTIKRTRSIVVVFLCVCWVPGIVLAEDIYQIYAPPTPSSIPFVLAARQMDNVDVTIFSSHSQANTLFLRGDIPILVTGLSVGINFFNNGVPIQIVNSYVSGLTYLVTRDKAVTSLKELQGQEIYLPFEGAPIEEITKFFAQQEGVQWGDELRPMYAPLQSTLKLMKQGKIAAAPLPQPLATIAAAQENIFLSFGYKDKWESITGQTDGYPQVGTFVKKEWAERHHDLIASLHQELERALRMIKDDPEQAVQQTQEVFQFPAPVLLASLKNISFALTTATVLQHDIEEYYQLLGHPLDEKAFTTFFYLGSK